MIFFKNKRKQELNLLDNYIELNKLISVCKSALSRVELKGRLKDLFGNVYSSAVKLKSSYQKIFLRLKMIDISFKQLDEQLESSYKYYSKFSSFDNELFFALEQKLRSLKENLIYNLKNLNLNTFEKNYILGGIIP